MDNIQLPPPAPRKSMSLGVKILLLGLQCGLLMICALAIWIMSYSREERNNDVAEQIASEWGRSVYINGPTFKEHLDSAAWVRPSSFICAANVNTKSLHRNIYEAEVFNASIKLAGSFSKDSISMFSDIIYLELGVDTKQIAKLSDLKIGGQTVNWSKSDYFLFAKVDVSDMPWKRRVRLTPSGTRD